jgi:hypothetical protein
LGSQEVVFCRCPEAGDSHMLQGYAGQGNALRQIFASISSPIILSLSSGWAKILCSIVHDLVTESPGPAEKRHLRGSEQLELVEYQLAADSGGLFLELAGGWLAAHLWSAAALGEPKDLHIVQRYNYISCRCIWIPKVEHSNIYPLPSPSSP